MPCGTRRQKVEQRDKRVSCTVVNLVANVNMNHATVKKSKIATDQSIKSTDKFDNISSEMKKRSVKVKSVVTVPAKDKTSCKKLAVSSDQHVMTESQDEHHSI